MWWYSFDPGIPDALAADEDALAKKRIYPDLRRAEARYFPVVLRNTLESSAQWGAVRVAPDSVQFVDLAVSGTIIESTGKRLVLQITARDAAGRVWLDGKRYEGDADIGSYKTDAALKARDPFQNVYSAIANDLLQARDRLAAAELRELRQVSELQFAQDIAPDALAGYLRSDGVKKSPLTRVARLPAQDDPVAQRVRDPRAHGRHARGAAPASPSRCSSRMGISAAQRRDRQGRARAVQRAARPSRRGGGGGHLSQAAAAMPPATWRARRAMPRPAASPRSFPVSRNADAKTTRRFSASSRARSSPRSTRVVDEGWSRLTGSAEEQYREWRRLLREYGRRMRPWSRIPDAGRWPLMNPESGKRLADRYLQQRLGDGGHAEVGGARYAMGARSR
jgi:hypothetical protein